MDAGRNVCVGPLRFKPVSDVPEGNVKVAVRPEAWLIGPPGSGMEGRLKKAAYLGSTYEYTFDTELGPIFVVSPDLAKVLTIDADVGLSLAGHGVSVVQAA
jgi:iron(III) transport system ATP-binding protein